jgi:hypothetical protein
MWGICDVIAWGPHPTEVQPGLYATCRIVAASHRLRGRETLLTYNFKIIEFRAFPARVLFLDLYAATGR